MSVRTARLSNAVQGVLQITLFDDRKGLDDTSACVSYNTDALGLKSEQEAVGACRLTSVQLLIE